jgi:hypothetical protein
MLRKVDLISIYTYTLHRVAGRTASFILMSGANPLARSVSSIACLRISEFSSRSKGPLEASGKSIDARETRAPMAWSTFILRCPRMRAINLETSVKYELILLIISAPAKSYATHQVEVIRRIDVLFTDAQIVGKTAHTILEYQQLRVCPRSAAVCKVRMVSSADLPVSRE